jgi:hypothetical protein
VGCGRASGRTCLANLSALGVARDAAWGAQVVLKPAKPPAHRVPLCLASQSWSCRRVRRLPASGFRFSLPQTFQGECVPVSGRLTKLLFWAITRDAAHRVCARGPQGLAERQLPGGGR